MPDFIPLNKLDHTDINMYQCGSEACKPGHYYGPAVRDHFLIHYIHSGKGIFQVGNETYHLEKGNGFLICPNIVTYYQADMHSPWTYSWIGFHGLKAESYLKRANLTLSNPIFKYDRDDFIENCFEQMHKAANMSRGKETRLYGLLYLFLSQLIEFNGTDVLIENRKELYVKKVVQFIELNYPRKISVNEIARYVGLDRSYLCSVFKDYLNNTIQEYLINFRIGKSCDLLENNNLSIGDVSRSVGYDDPLLFSKIFKKIKGLSPREYRKSLNL